MTRRLIETWLPIAALGEESVRERRSMTALPPTYYLHVWWARRPLVASRAAILASLLPADADHEKFTHLLGIHGDPVAAKKAMDRARRTGIRVDDPYGYSRAFTHLPDEDDLEWFRLERSHIVLNGASILDPTAGGGSVPFESVRLGLTTWCNDLNPVAVLIERATLEWTLRFGMDIKREFERVSRHWQTLVETQLNNYFPQLDAPDQIDTTYIWARTVTCPYCNGLVPLSPNWRLAPDGTGVHMRPNRAGGPNSPGRRVHFDIVKSAKEHSMGTVSGGDATCCFDDCARLMNFDSPWNPMRIEQRIGRIDRLGQQFPEIRIVNLMYEDTVETDVYRALRNRIGLFTAVVGKLQPILASLPRRIADATLAPVNERAGVRDRLLGSLNAAVDDAEAGFDIDEATTAALEEPVRPDSPYTLEDLRLLLQKPEMLPDGVSVQQLGNQEFAYRSTDQLEPIRVTTDPDFYLDNPESTEFWTPGNPLFPAHVSTGTEAPSAFDKLNDFLVS